MHIKSIELSGFRSYKNTVKVDAFSPGLNVIGAAEKIFLFLCLGFSRQLTSLSLGARPDAAL